MALTERLPRNHITFKQDYLYLLSLNNIMKCSSNCARCDWSVRVQYSSIKHGAYVTRVLYRVFMHAVYVTSLSARCFLSIL